MPNATHLELLTVMVGANVNSLKNEPLSDFRNGSVKCWMGSAVVRSVSELCRVAGVEIMRACESIDSEYYIYLDYYYFYIYVAQDHTVFYIHEFHYSKKQGVMIKK